ncbi:PRD domain-containing protein, partial [Bacillus licheniformis]
NVTTSMVLDAVRKVNYLNLNLHAIYDSVTKDFIDLWADKPRVSGKKKAIVSICTTGGGTAKKLEEILTSIVSRTSDEQISILTVPSIKLASRIKEIEKAYEILATVGTKNPKIDAPHVPLEVLIEGEGEKVIQQVIATGDIPMSGGLSGENVVVKELCEDSLKKYLVFLNPYHVIDMLLEWLQTVQDELRMTFSNAVLIKVIMHTAFAFERVIKQNPIAFPEEEEMNDQLENVLHITEKTLKPYEEKLGLAISEDEKMFIASIFAEEL